MWQAEGKDTWISIFERDDYSEESWHLDYEEKDAFKCIFVGRPTDLIDKHKPKTQEQLDEENNQAILNAEDPNYPIGDNGTYDYFADKLDWDARHKLNTNEEG